MAGLQAEGDSSQPLDRRQWGGAALTAGSMLRTAALRASQVRGSVGGVPVAQQQLLAKTPQIWWCWGPASPPIGLLGVYALLSTPCWCSWQRALQASAVCNSSSPTHTRVCCVVRLQHSHQLIHTHMLHVWHSCVCLLQGQEATAAAVLTQTRQYFALSADFSEDVGGAAKVRHGLCAV